MTFHLGLLFNSIQCCNLGFRVFWVLIFQIERTAIITWGGLAALWPGLLLFFMALGKTVSSQELRAVTISPSSFLFRLLSIPLLFPTCLLQICLLGSFPAPQEQQCSTQPALLSSLALALLMAGHQNPSCISDAQLHMQFNFGQESLQNGAVRW